MRRNLALIPVIGLVILVACGENATETSNGGSSPGTDNGTDSPTQTDPNATVRLQVALEPESLDVTTTSGAAVRQVLIPNVYESLVDRTPDGEFVPALAEDWEMSEDGLIYTFELREDVVFHDGEPMTVEDVVWSLNEAAAEDSLNPHASRFDAVEQVRATDDFSVEITLSERNINFLDALTSHAGVILSEGSAVDLANTTNGTGPYTVTQWNQGSTIALTRFDDYWGEDPSNAEVVFHFIDDEVTAANALNAGEIDIFTTATEETRPLFEGDESFTISEGDSTSWMTLGFNTAEEPFDDPHVRQAIRMAIDKDGLIDIMGGQMIRTGGMSVPSDPWYEDLTDIHSYDPEGATELLNDAGYEDLSLTFRVSNTYDTRIGEYIAAQLSDIGVDMSIDTMEFSAWLEEVFQGTDYEMTMVLHVDPWTLLQYSNPGYYWNYDDADAQELATDATAATSLEERDELLSELARHVSEEAASDWLYSPLTVVVSDESVSGYPVDRIVDRLPVKEIQVASE